MANDYDLNANVTVNSKGFTSGINKALSSLSDFVKKLGKNGLVGSLGSVGLAMGSVGLALGAAKKSFQKIAKVVGECTEAYKKQYIAEEQLRQAINNNPYVSGESTKALLDFASAIQKTSN